MWGNCILPVRTSSDLAGIDKLYDFGIVDDAPGWSRSQGYAICQGTEVPVIDELHTYRGRQGADVAMLVRRFRERLNPNVLCIGK